MSKFGQPAIGLGDKLSKVLDAVCAVEEAAADRDWKRVARTNTELDSELGSVDQLIGKVRSAGSQGELRRVAACLAEVLERHGRAQAMLLKARAAAATELRGLRQGGRAAALFMDTADA